MIAVYHPYRAILAQSPAARQLPGNLPADVRQIGEKQLTSLRNLNGE